MPNQVIKQIVFLELEDGNEPVADLDSRPRIFFLNLNPLVK
jgi:hypothetical protein